MQMASYKMFHVSRFQPLAIITYPVFSKWNLAVFSSLNFALTLLDFGSKHIVIIYLPLPDVMISKVLVKKTLIFKLGLQITLFLNSFFHSKWKERLKIRILPVNHIQTKKCPRLFKLSSTYLAKISCFKA